MSVRLILLANVTTMSSESSSLSLESVEFALSVSLVMALALVLIVLEPALVRLSLVLSVLHLYGVTTGALSLSESDWVRFRPAPPLVFLTPLLGDSFRAMVVNILAFVALFHTDPALLVPNTSAPDIG